MAKHPVTYIVRVLSLLFFFIYVVALVFANNIPENAKVAVKHLALNRIESEYKKAVELATEKDAVNKVTNLLEQFIPNITDKTDVLSTRFREEADALFENTLLDEKAMKEFYKKNKDDYQKFNVIQAIKEKQYMKSWLTVRYIHTLAALSRELQINIICNLIIYLSIFVITFIPGFKSNIGLLILMIVISLFTAYSYFAHTNWFFKVLMNNYAGYSYLITYLFIFIFVFWQAPGLLLNNFKRETKAL